MNDSNLIGILEMQLSSKEFSSEQKLEIIGKLTEIEKEKEKAKAEIEKEKAKAEIEKEITNRSLFYNIRILFTNNKENKEVHSLFNFYYDSYIYIYLFVALLIKIYIYIYIYIY